MCSIECLLMDIQTIAAVEYRVALNDGCCQGQDLKCGDRGSLIASYNAFVRKCKRDT